MSETIISNLDAAGSHTLQVISQANRFNQWMYDSFKKYLKGNVLEIGSGIGNISQLVVNDNFSITLSDYNSQYVAWLQKKFKENKKVKDIIRIDLLNPDFKKDYSFLKEQFDSIFLLNVIEHLKDDQQAVENCRFILKPCGNLILLAPSYQWLYCNFDKELGHYKRYAIKDLEALLKNLDLTVIKKQYFNFTGITGWLIMGKLFKQKLIGKKEMTMFDKLVPLSKFIDKIVFNKIGLSLIVTAQKK